MYTLNIFMRNSPSYVQIFTKILIPPKKTLITIQLTLYPHHPLHQHLLIPMHPN